MKKILLFGLLFFTTLISFAQNILVDGVNDPNEVSIAINPKNTQELAAGSNLQNYYYSHDGGQTWTANYIYSASGVWGDPMLLCDTAGNFYFFHLSAPGGQSWDSAGFLDRIVCQKSTDGGVTYPGDYFFGQQNQNRVEDKEWSCVDPATNFIYSAWTEDDRYSGIPTGYTVTSADSSRILFARSTDGGVTWSAPVTISTYEGNCYDSDSTNEGAVPCVAPNGDVYVVYSLGNSILFTKSTDHGLTWLPVNTLAANQIGGWDITVSGFYRTNGMTVSGCDLSNSPYHGTVYINWSDIRNGASDPDVFICKSTDGGTNWSAPIRVNNDTTHTPQFSNWMSVDPITGNVYVAYYDRSLHSGNDSTDVFLARSTDGGATFTNQRINTESFLPDNSIFPGDYINVAAYNGNVHVIWTKIETGVGTSVWTNYSYFQPTGVANNFSESINEITLANPMPNPAAERTFIQFNNQHEEKLSLQLFSITGEKMLDIFSDKNFSAGWHGESFSTVENNISAGSYLLVLKNEKGIVAVKKMVCVK